MKKIYLFVFSILVLVFFSGNTYTLLIGKKALGGVPGKLIKQDVSLSCDSTELTYNVEIQNGGYTAIGNFIFGVLIPKSNATVKFNVDVKKQP